MRRGQPAMEIQILPILSNCKADRMELAIGEEEREWHFNLNKTSVLLLCADARKKETGFKKGTDEI